MKKIISFINLLKMNRNKVLLSVFTLLILTTVFVIKNNILAQVSTYVFYAGASVESPAHLKEVPEEFGSHSTNVRPDVSTNRSQAESQNGQLPDYVVYGQIFRHIKELHKKANEEERLGRDGNHFRKLYQNMANLTNQETVVLDSIAMQVNEDLSVIDTRARIIIANLRAQTPEGKLQEGQEPPSPPAELLQLSNQRKEIILEAKNKLESQFGSAGFAKFQSFVDTNVKPGIKPIN